jgi:hypothetical protein
MKTILTVLALLVAGTALAQTASTNKVQPVNVTNPSLNVNVTNNPLPVSVTNATTNQNVTVTNTNPIPVSMADPLVNFHFQFNVGRGTNPNGTFCSNQYVVPTGKRLFISHVAFRVVANTASMVGGEFDVQNGTTVFQTYFNAVPGVVTTITGTARNQFQGAQAVDVEADGGSTVTFGVVLSPVDLSGGCDFSISGLLVDSP